MKIKVGQLKKIIREAAEAAAAEEVAAIVEPEAQKAVAKRASALETAFAKATPEEIADLRSLAGGDVPQAMGEADEAPGALGDVKTMVKKMEETLMAGMATGALAGLMKSCADEAMMKSYPHFAGAGTSQNIVAGVAIAGTVALTAAAIEAAYDAWKSKQGASTKAEGALRLTPGLLRSIIAEEVEAAATRKPARH